MDSMEDWFAFRSNETPRRVRLVCCDCGKPSQGNVSCDDGDICDACHAQYTSDDMETKETKS